MLQISSGLRQSTVDENILLCILIETLLPQASNQKFRTDYHKSLNVSIYFHLNSRNSCGRRKNSEQILKI